VSRNLVIFIDGFPYYYLRKAEYFSTFSRKLEVIPGFGYSVNIHAELFGGYTPDDVGYFNEWGLKTEASSLGKIRPLIALLDLLGRFYLLDRILHKTISYQVGFIGNIPFRYVNEFSRRGRSIYSKAFPKPTLFSKNILRLILPCTSEIGMKDREVYIKALEAIGKVDNVFVAFEDLDGISHKYGVGSPQYDHKIRELDQWVRDLVTKFLRETDKGKVVVLSDHGMVNVTQGVRIDLESKIGHAGRDTYLYFLDSTLLRVWVFDDGLWVKINNYLSSLNCGMVINFREREKYGISNREWGDIIFLLNEGNVFSPSFLGRKLPKAMHGYHPELESQKGIFLFSGPGDFKPTGAIRTIDAFLILRGLLNL